MTWSGWRGCWRTCRWCCAAGCGPPGVLAGAAAPAGRGGGHRVHGEPLRCADPATWAGPSVTAVADTPRYGPVQVTACGRMHPKLERDSAWHDHPGRIPVIEGTMIRLRASRLPRDGRRKPAWLWASDPAAGPAEVAVLWQAYLRRFDLEHTFRFFKQVLGWTAPLLRDPAAADRWTWLVIAACTQLRLAAPLAADLRLPWQRPQPAARARRRTVTPPLTISRSTSPALASTPLAGVLGGGGGVGAACS